MPPRVAHDPVSSALAIYPGGEAVMLTAQALDAEVSRCSSCDRGLIPMPALPGSRRGGPTRSLWSAALGYLAARRNPQRVGVLPIAVEGEHPLDDALDAVTLVRNPAEVAQVLLTGGNVVGQVGAPTRLCPATTIFGASAATASRLAIHASRFCSSVSSIIM